MIDFTPIKGVTYRNNYEAIFRDIANGVISDKAVYRSLILNDLFFIVYFVMEIGIANCGFVVDACRLVEDGPDNGTLDIWAREHFKSTIITIAETVQYHLRNPNHCTCIFSYKKTAAEDFLDSIRKTYEKEIMWTCFPDILYSNPTTESSSWSLQNGITLRRSGVSRKEATVETSGLVEGMCTGKHFERRIYDDVETDDIAENPDQMEKCFSKFEMSDFLGTNGGVERVLGTYYSHCGPLVRIRDKKTADGKAMYTTRIKSGSDDGTATGAPVFVSEERWAKLKMGQHFNSQILCDPTPAGTRPLHGKYLSDIDVKFIPRSVYKFMIIDPAGDDKGKDSDDWAVLMIGVEPKGDEAGNSNVYIMDMMLNTYSETAVIDEIVRMYLRHGIVHKVGVEKVALSTTEIHISNALAKRGRMVNTDNGTLQILKPSGRKKTKRIELLEWPLNNGKLFISKDIPATMRDKLRLEFDNFPVGHDDGIDALAYIYDIIKDYRFVLRGDEGDEGGKMESKWNPYEEKRL